jgi:hypothetical protein
MCFQDNISFPEGTPNDISLVWIKNLISQNCGNGTIDLLNLKCYDLAQNNKTLLLDKYKNTYTLTINSSNKKNEGNTKKVAPFIYFLIGLIIYFLSTVPAYGHNAGAGH